MHRGVRVTHVIGVMNEIPCTQLIFVLLGAIHILRNTIHGLPSLADHFFSSDSSETPRAQPNNIRAAVWLSFWFSTRPSPDACTNYNVLPHNYRH